MIPPQLKKAQGLEHITSYLIEMDTSVISDSCPSRMPTIKLGGI